MKTLPTQGIIIIIGLLWFVSAANAELQLGAAQSWAYEFTSLPLLGTEAATTGAESAGGVHLTIGSFAPPDHYTLQIFENSLDEEPVWTTDSDNNQSGSAGYPFGLWQDLQGWVKLSVLQGEISVEDVQIDARIPIDASTTRHYQTAFTVPVPEPSGLKIGCVFLGCLAAAELRRRRRIGTAYRAR